MSKLAHSHQPTMNEIDRRHAIEDGVDIRECWACGATIIDGKPADECTDPDCPQKEGKCDVLCPLA
jgi:hypothetical protein